MNSHFGRILFPKYLLIFTVQKPPQILAKKVLGGSGQKFLFESLEAVKSRPRVFLAIFSDLFIEKYPGIMVLEYQANYRRNSENWPF